MYTGRWIIHLPGLSSRSARDECVAEHLEESCVRLAARTTKGVDRRANLYIHETAVFEQLPPTCTRQATGNSIGPEIDVGLRGVRHRFAGGDVRELQNSPGAQDAPDLGEYL